MMTFMFRSPGGTTKIDATAHAVERLEHDLAVLGARTP